MTARISPGSVDLLDRELAARWGGADLPLHALYWRWFSGAMDLCAHRSMVRLDFQGTLDRPALADAFFRWASQIDSTSEYRELDPLDYAHFSAGLMLRMLLSVPVLKVTPQTPPRQHGIDPATAAWMAWPEAAVLTRLALTFLDASRRSVGAEPLELAPKVHNPPVVASFYENVREDPALVNCFFDEFTGADPHWSAAIHVTCRPAIQRALAAAEPGVSGLLRSRATINPDRPSPANGPILREVKLAVKDTLREIRQNLHQGGRSLASQVKSTARLIQGADRVAQDFFNNDAQYRSLGFRLRPVADYLADDGGRPATAKPFTKALFWAIRHLVELSGSQDVVVYEQAIHRTWQRLVDAARTEFPRDASSTARSRLAASLVIEELCRQDEPPLLRILGEPKAAPEDEDACKRRAAALALQCSAAAILAGEIADRVAAPSPEAATRTALAQAREIVAGRHAAWQAAFDGRARRQDLAAELALVTSHF